MTDTVVVKVGNADGYHRPKRGDTVGPACYVEGHGNPELWREWPIDRAIVWRDPCQYEACFGDTPLLYD